MPIKEKQFEEISEDDETISEDDETISEDDETISEDDESISEDDNKQMTDEKYIAQMTKIYEALKERIINATIKSGDCIILKNNQTRFRLRYKGTIYDIPTLIYINYNQTTLGNNRIRRKCKTKNCINSEHLILTKDMEIDFDAAWKRLSKKGKRDETTNCLLWTGLIEKVSGYGLGSFNGNTEKMHIISYKIKEKILTVPKSNKKGEILQIRHMCKNKNCFEPSHLELGTISQNQYDDKLRDGTLVRGSKHPNTNLTEEIVRQIKLSNYPKEHKLHKTYAERAKEFNVSKQIIRSIDKGRSWGHISDRDGNTIESRKLKKRPKNTKDWTPEMFLVAKEKIKKCSSEDDKTGCWIWNQTLTKAGYGRISVCGKRRLAHIVSCEAKYGYKQPDGQVTRHLCDNKSCVNPDHLEFGSQYQNIIDTIISNKDNRFRTEEIVKDIRNTHNKDGLTREERAKKYNLSLCTMNNIEKRKTYKHIV
jgi:DNA-binding XRE family transcriptional regulator